MAMDALLLFCERIGAQAGTDMTRLFGMPGINLRKSEIYIQDKRGISCGTDINGSSSKVWPLGRLVLNDSLRVAKILFVLLLTLWD